MIALFGQHRWHSIVLLAIVSSSPILVISQLGGGARNSVTAVSVGQLDKLTREQLLRLDREVSDYFLETYEQLDLAAATNSTTSITYDEQLFKSIKALRHTTVINHFDFRYTNNKTLWDSMGAQVEASSCRRQLRVLNQLARMHSADEPLPLSVVDFFEASGSAGSGVLNGDFVWLGSETTCLHSTLSARLLEKFNEHIQAQRKGKLVEPAALVGDIRGRYCVAHLRARSWPKWDPYFENRITLRRGVCLPQSCHSALYESDDEIRQLINSLAQHTLARPFGDTDRYETQTVYCFPDEDSPFRQLDLGAKLFVAFLAFWVTLTLWTNFKYHWRSQAVQRLRDLVDIKMIINERRDDDDDEQDDSAEDETRGRGSLAARDSNLLGSAAGEQSAPGSALSSAASTPLPSDLEDASETEPNKLIESFRVRKRKKTKKAGANFNYGGEGGTGAPTSAEAVRRASGGAPTATAAPTTSKQSEESQSDFLRDFSIERNLAWLLKSRAKTTRTTTAHVQPTQHLLVNPRGSNVQQQLAAVARRTSSSNEALIKDLQGQSEHQPKVAVVSSSGGTPAADDEPVLTSNRVDIDILDGLKVVATSWIVLGHTLMCLFVFAKDLRFSSERMFDVTMTVTINTLQVVGLFYVTTGCLLTYISFSKARHEQLLKPHFWLLVLIGRYVRLMPAYLLVFWFARHVAPHMGSGRDWLDYRTDEEHPRGYCGQESWWVMLSMSAADVKIPMDCVPQAWYLSDDFRTLLVLPLYVFLLAKNALLGYLAIIATIGYSFAKLAYVLMAANIDYKLILHWQPHVYGLMVDRLHDVYTDFFVRISTYLLGVIVGHLLYLYEIRYIKRWPEWLKMRFALLTAMGFFFGAQVLSNPLVNKFLPKREDLNSDHVVWLVPLFKLAMEVSLAITILLLVTGGGFKWARRTLSSKAMKVLSNISYVVFLTHVEIMYKIPATIFESNYWYLALYTIVLIAVSHAVAFFVHLLYEMPLNNITRRIMKRAAKILG